MIELPGWAVVMPRRLEHVARVVALVESWAGQRGLSAAETARWRRAALLHDALKDAGPDQLERYVPRGDWPLPLWHGPAAAAAALHGEADQGVLSAVRYHSTGFAGWDDVGPAIYLGDFLEPGRTHAPGPCAAWALRLPREWEQVLREVAASRIGRLLASGKSVPRETWEFWNKLTRDA